MFLPVDLRESRRERREEEEERVLGSESGREGHFSV